MILVTRDQVAQLRGCTPSTVSRAHLPKASGDKYDLCNVEVWTYVTTPSLERRIEEIRRVDREALGEDDVDGLEAEKLQAEIEWKKKQSRKLDVQHEIDVKNLGYISDFVSCLNVMRTQIKLNFLNLGDRISRGDKKLRDRIDKEVTRSLDRVKKASKSEIDRILGTVLDDE